jgi:EmrB/QacA subfamily drug resistance transporter
VLGSAPVSLASSATSDAAVSRKWWALAAVTFSLFMIMLDNTVVSVALPAIQRSLHASLSELEWVVDAYALAFAVLLLSGGKLADFLGRRRIFAAGLAVFTLSSLWCALSTSGGMLVAARGVQGAGAALMLPATISIITDAFPANERGMAFGIWAGVSGAGLAIGPLVGGFLVDFAHWSWIFYVNVPVGLVGIAASFLLIRESRDVSAERRLDMPGLVTSGAAMFLVVFALLESNKRGWGSTLIIASFVGSAVLLLGFVAVEQRQRLPMIDLSLFRNPTFVGANGVGLLIMCSLFGFIFFMSLWLQSVRGYSPLHAGATFLISTVAMSLVAPFAGKLADRAGGRPPITVGMAVFGLSLVVLSRQVGVHSAVWHTFPTLFVGGLGFGLILPPATTTVVAVVPENKSGVASGMMQAIRQLGGALGVATAGAIMNAKTGGLAPRDPHFASSFVSGLHQVLLFTGCVSIAGAVVGALLIRRGPRAEYAEALEFGASPPPP